MLPTDGDNPEGSRQFALQMLDELRKQQHKIRYHKLYFMRLARDHGASFDEIGAAFGVTGEAVRMFLRRAGDSEAA